MPFLAKFPLAFGNGGQKKGGITSAFSTVMDLAPTILEMAGVSHPSPDGKGSYEGRPVVSMRGRSMVPFLTYPSSTRTIHPADFIHGWETCGRAAVRCGDFKVSKTPRATLNPCVRY